MVRELLSAAAAALALAPFEAHATTMVFSFETATFSVSGDVAVSDTLDSIGGYDVTGISGAVSGPNGGAITTLIANPTRPAAYGNGSRVYDTVVFSSGPWVDGSGLLFATGGARDLADDGAGLCRGRRG